MELVVEYQLYPAKTLVSSILVPTHQFRHLSKYSDILILKFSK